MYVKNTKAVSKVSYENKEYILQFFEGVHEEENRTELIEVYRKAKAFDEICKAHEPLEKRMSPVTVDEGLDFAEETEKIILKHYESGESE